MTDEELDTIARDAVRLTPIESPGSWPFAVARTAVRLAQGWTPENPDEEDNKMADEYVAQYFELAGYGRKDVEDARAGKCRDDAHKAALLAIRGERERAKQREGK
jgi:hypothetical protein